MKRINRTQSDNDRYEPMEIEFVGGGPLDGIRLFLDVVKEGPGAIRVLEMGYEGPTTRRDAEQERQARG